MTRKFFTTLLTNSGTVIGSSDVIGSWKFIRTLTPFLTSVEKKSRSAGMTGFIFLVNLTKKINILFFCFKTFAIKNTFFSTVQNNKRIYTEW